VTLSVLQDLIPEAIPSQKCHMNMSPILSCYGATDIWNGTFMRFAASKIRFRSSSLLFTLRLFTMFSLEF
jgi:hypothetical protein